MLTSEEMREREIGKRLADADDDKNNRIWWVAYRNDIRYLQAKIATLEQEIAAANDGACLIDGRAHKAEARVQELEQSYGQLEDLYYDEGMRVQDLEAAIDDALERAPIIGDWIRRSEGEK